MRAPSEDIKDLLDGESGLGLTYAQNLFIGTMPDSPSACVVVVDSGGMDPESGYEYERPTVQVRVREEPGGYLTAYALAQQIKARLHGSNGEVVGGSRYIGIWAQGDVLSVGNDQADRPQVTVNFRLHRTSSS